VSTPIVERIQLLLNKAERTDNEHEADAFFAAAQTLMQRHAIEEHDLPGNQRKETIVKRIVPAKKTMAMRSAMQRLLGGIARANRSRLVNAVNREGGQFWIFGYESDAVFVEMLYCSVLVQMNVARRKAYKGYTGWDSRYVWSNNFALGYAEGIVDRLTKMAAESAAEVSAEAGNSVALFDRSAEVNDWMEANLSLKKGRSMRRYIGEGYQGGFNSAKDANLSGGRNNLAGRGALGR
jgi:hypothetical protein